MCGIAGTYNQSGQSYGRGHGESRQRLEAMGALIAHRGPESEGYLIDGPVALANRRLAVIDLSSAGRQPLFNEDGQIGIV
jgi:asparagine synthase (glutamine-hydrolysing)